jgi:hypothetical protein
MNEFDQNARQAGKLDEVSFLTWVLRHYTPPPPLVFQAWDDTRRKSWEGGPDRTNDLVALLRDPAHPECRAWLIVEFESEPERFLFQRLGVYELLLSLEVATQLGLSAQDTIPVGSTVIHLTGQRDSTAITLTLPGTVKGTRVEPLVINLRQEEAAATLADIAAGRTGRCLLVWVPLMAGGGQPALIEEWKRLVLVEPKQELRAQYRSLALVFAELTREQVNWQQALEGWEMLESQTIRGWKREGELKGNIERARAYLLELIRGRFQDPVPEPVRLAVEGTNDLDSLDRWFKVAVRADSLAAFLTAMKENP